MRKRDSGRSDVPIFMTEKHIYAQPRDDGMKGSAVG